MIRSMTGFGSSNYDDEVYHLSIEIKAVNNRYCDIQLKIPNTLRFLEQAIYKQIKDYKFRGKIEVAFKFRYTPKVNTSLSVDKSLLIAYYNTLKSMRETLVEVDPNLNLAQITYGDLLEEPGIVNLDETLLDREQVEEIIKKTMAEALMKFNETKLTEGKALAQDILSRIDLIGQYVQSIETLAPARLENYKAHLQELIMDLTQDVELAYKEQRIIQEVALMADRLDITEEITRFASHIQQFHKHINGKTGVGRSLDFLLQEMNREANTIGSKANHSEIAHLVVAIKGELEKIREQIQNIE